MTKVKIVTISNHGFGAERKTMKFQESNSLTVERAISLLRLIDDADKLVGIEIKETL